MVSGPVYPGNTGTKPNLVPRRPKGSSRANPFPVMKGDVGMPKDASKAIPLLQATNVRQGIKRRGKKITEDDPRWHPPGGGSKGISAETVRRRLALERLRDARRVPPPTKGKKQPF